MAAASCFGRPRAGLAARLQTDAKLGRLRYFSAVAATGTRQVLLYCVVLSKWASEGTRWQQSAGRATDLGAAGDRKDTFSELSVCGSGEELESSSGGALQAGCTLWGRDWPAPD